MKATIEVWGMKATIKGWAWTGAEAEFVGQGLFLDMLNAMLDPAGPSGADPAPNYHEAQRVADQFGGKVVDFELPEYVKGRVY